MDTVIGNYYKGFEGEPEIQFICNLKDNKKLILSLWEGYFDRIMNAVAPQKDGWTALAYYYHLHEGWYENSPWEMSDINATINQLNQINTDILDKETKKILIHICEFLANAQRTNNTVWIMYT